MTERALPSGRSAAARFAAAAGALFDSWSFIVAQTVFALVWTGMNLLALDERWVPDRLLAVGLAVATQAAYAPAFVLLSQIRLADSARVRTGPRNGSWPAL